MSPACRFCGAPLTHSFCDLGATPLSNAYLEPETPSGVERTFPLHARVCGACFLVQLPELESPSEIFTDYAYFSSYSVSWLAHAEAFARTAIRRYGLDGNSRVVEVASNDGYLLQYFQAAGIPVLGIEPAGNVAAEAQTRGIPTRVAFFGLELAQTLRTEGMTADLLVANNVLAHVPNLNDFVAGLARLLAPNGVLSLEFPHLLQLIEQAQFDTIYHEHFSYFSLQTAEEVLAAQGLRVFDVEELDTHGGSLRVNACRVDSAHERADHVTGLIDRERAAGLRDLSTYAGFQARAETVRSELMAFLDRARQADETVAAYGAPAKGNSLLNFCGIGSDRIAYTVDRSPHKQGKLLPGSRLPVYAPERLALTRPRYVLILPWNLRDEIQAQMSVVREWGGRFVVPIPRLEVLP